MCQGWLVVCVCRPVCECVCGVCYVLVIYHRLAIHWLLLLLWLLWSITWSWNMSVHKFCGSCRRYQGLHVRTTQEVCPSTRNGYAYTQWPVAVQYILKDFHAIHWDNIHVIQEWPLASKLVHFFVSKTHTIWSSNPTNGPRGQWKEKLGNGLSHSSIEAVGINYEHWPLTEGEGGRVFGGTIVPQQLWPWL